MIFSRASYFREFRDFYKNRENKMHANQKSTKTIKEKLANTRKKVQTENSRK